jgi:hypothetical protein
MKHRRALLTVAALLPLPLTACATTIVDTVNPSSTSSTTTTTMPMATLDDLLDALLIEVAALSEIVVETGGDRAFEQLATIEALWARARPAVVRDHAGLVGDFDRMLALCRLGVERRRPAEADKAYAFLIPLVAAVSTSS